MSKLLAKKQQNFHMAFVATFVATNFNINTIENLEIKTKNTLKQRV